VTVRSKLLGINASIPTTGTVIYTTPANTRTICKDIIVTNNGGAAAKANIAVLSGATILFNFQLPMAASGAAGDFVDHPLWLVLLPGYSIKVFASVGTIQACLSGAELPL
jgi:hypothetical protein